MNKTLKSLSLPEIDSLTKSLKQPSFRAKQLAEWLYAKHVSSYDEMTNLPNTLRAQLKEEFLLCTPSVTNKQVSKDNTQKFVLSFHDNTQTEMVAIPSKDGRLTVCCSTQVGCAMGCSFCATGKEGFTRNLSVGEIVDQIFIAQEHLNVRVSNVVLMGQGEPFLNYDNTLNALKIINHPKFLNIGARHITISTCGIIPGIARFSNEPEQFTLAVSLHSAIQATRDSIMPGAAKYPLTQLKEALRQYITKTNRRITLEYALMAGVNDQAEDLKALQGFCDSLLCHINLIPLNRIDNSPFMPSSQETMTHWQNSLARSGSETTIRNSRGGDIAGACGQLKNLLV